MAKFIVQHGYNQRTEFVIPEGETRIGRSAEGNDLVLRGSGVSRRHAAVQRKAADVTIEDQGSSNGTFLNSQPIAGRVRLKHKDVVQIGDVVLIYDDMEIEPAGGSEADSVPITSLDALQLLVQRIQENVAKVICGKDEVIRQVLVGLISDGHVLLEDVPGVGKTVLCQALSKSIRAEFKRIQFTPDMLPNDVTGVTIYDDARCNFTFVPGPIFANVVLADEINRATPRTQSSLLECMSEAVVTVDGQAHVLPKPFFVIATQNPVEFHGTYPLPEAQLDRFLMRLRMGYPDKATEQTILTSQSARNPLNEISYVSRTHDILQCQALVRTVHVADAVKDYLASIAEATRQHQALSYGCSPRATLALMRAGQSLAATHGRNYVLPRDIRQLAPHVLSHRMPIKLHARADWESSTQVVEKILEQLPIERWETGDHS